MAVHKCTKETEIALLKQNMEYDHKLLEEVHAAVVGTKDEKGLKGRVSDIENTQSNIKIFGSIIAFIITVGLTILAFFKGGK